MDPAAIGALVSSVLSGGASAIIALLLFVLIGAIVVIKYLLGQLKIRDEKQMQSEERYFKLLEEYHAGNSTVTDALNDVKMVLVEIRAKL